MVNQQLLIFIKQSLSQGVDKEKITNDLLSNGWNKQDIEEGFISLDISNTNNSEIKIPETQIKKTQKTANDSSGVGLKIVIAILILIVLLVFGFIFYKGAIEKNKIKDNNLANETQEQLEEQTGLGFEEKQVEIPNVVGVTPESDLPVSSEDVKTVNKPESNKTVSVKTEPVNCGKDTSCLIKAAKTCTPAFLEETKILDIFGLIQTNKTKTILSGLDSSNKCIYSSIILDADLSYSPEMISFIKSETEKEGVVLTPEQEKELYTIDQESIDSVKSTIGMTTKCAFTPTYLTELLTKWAKGSYSSGDMKSGNCKITDSNGKQIPTMGTISFSTGDSSNTETTITPATKTSNEIDLYLNKQTIFSNKSISSSDLGFTLIEVADDTSDSMGHDKIYKISVKKISTGEIQTITYYDDSFGKGDQGHVFGVVIKNIGYSFVSGFLNNGIDETKVSFQVSKE